MSDYISRDKVAQAFEDADVDVCEDYGEYYGCEWGFSRDAVRKSAKNTPHIASVARFGLTPPVAGWTQAVIETTIRKNGTYPSLHAGRSRR